MTDIVKVLYEIAKEYSHFDVKPGEIARELRLAKSFSEEDIKFSRESYRQRVEKRRQAV